MSTFLCLKSFSLFIDMGYEIFCWLLKYLCVSKLFIVCLDAENMAQLHPICERIMHSPILGFVQGFTSTACGLCKRSVEKSLQVITKYWGSNGASMANKRTKFDVADKEESRVVLGPRHA